MDAPTPRTDAQIDDSPYYQSRFVMVSADFARTIERELIAANAQIVALRDALAIMLDSTFPHPVEQPHMSNAWNKAKIILSAPSPPVVPLEDVKPLIVAIQDVIITLGFGDDQSWLCRDRIKPALETFTAKYPQ